MKDEAVIQTLSKHEVEPVNGKSSDKVSADDPHKAEKLTASSVSGDLDEVEE